MTNSFRLPPHSIPAEESVIGSILLDGDLIKSTNLSASDFYYPQNGTIFQAMLNLKEKGVNLNEITVGQELQEMDKLKEIGGAAQLCHLVSICPTSLDCAYYADIVKRLATFRSLIVVSDKIAAIGYDSDKPVEKALADADDMILNLRKQAGSTHLITPDDRVKILCDRYEQLYTLEGGIAISTGLLDLDKLLGGGFFPGDYIVVGARPGVGKTSILKTVANHIGITESVLFCSGEMDVEGLSDRDVAGAVGVSVNAIRQGNYSIDLYGDILNKGIPSLFESKVFHIDASRNFQFSTANIYQAAYEMQVRYGLALIVVDYLGLLTDHFGNNNNDRLGFISRNLKEMAMDLKVPVLCAHQLNRALEGREDKRPQLHDLRDSGNIEQDADVVLFLYRENYYKKQLEDTVTEITVGKQRQGRSGGTVKVFWNDSKQMYCDLAKEGQEQML